MKGVSSRIFALSALMVVLSPVALASDPFDELDNAVDRFEQSPEQEQKEFQQFQASQDAEYKAFEKQLLEEFEAFKLINQEETAKYQAKVGKVWDKPEISSQKVWVEYANNDTQKKRVDFEKKTISISTAVEKNGDEKAPAADVSLKKTLKKLIKENKAQAFKKDEIAQAVEKRSKEKITNLKTAKVKAAPILLPYLTGNDQVSDKEIDKIVDHMVANKKQTVTVNSKGKKVVTLEVPLSIPEAPKEESKKEAPKPGKNEKAEPKKPKVMADLKQNKLPKSARALEPHVAQYAKKAKVGNALVFAIIETESAFNPMAKSGVPAYGLMQIVPGSAGQDATQQLFGKPKILSPSYLYNSEQNIEIGTTYLNILYYRYLKGVKDPVSRLYCSIAAYNTGAGNVAKAFTGKRRLKPALEHINAMTPQQVYDHLIKNLPYEETQKYLAKVHKRITKYSL
ncbi:transglycosylase SLT domain-containing protein [Alkalimarinus alittae]|uniref:Transglycosylase SLT domain-containing protein n=1 Tax=Alkalimarinus alittae TaxID=2961619 RepID=A0ABY6MZT9_9ALTE|nr:transglycosylase SLT domain-containing protein [Alkalimarinus alittae]UZE95310.1 transglycosylase SLT domain-containing protein [Alkalimarinus alittae]